MCYFSPFLLCEDGEKLLDYDVQREKIFCWQKEAENGIIIFVVR